MMFNHLLETTFGLFYVMTEGLDSDGSAQKTRVSIFLVLIDMGQVLRAITNPQYGWTIESKDAVSWIDIVYIVTSLRVIPRLVFFLTAVVLIIGALADTVYVAKIFQGGTISNMLPVKILRFLVGAIVTTLFTTVLEWVLYPTECLLAESHYDHQSLSELLRGSGASCTPFGSLEIGITLPTIIVTAIYIAYSLVTMLLAFEINPLSRNPWAHSTGRVECLWTALKVAAIVLPFLSQFLSSIVVSILLFGLSAVLFWLHLTHMPFHDIHTNVVRGGVYGAVSWLALSSVVASNYPPTGADSQLRQWVLLALLPVLFAAAAIVVYQRQGRIVNFVHLLRGEFAALRNNNSSLQPSYALHEELAIGCSALEDGSAMVLSEQDLMAKTVFDKFYDLDYERNRAFKTGAEALVVARTLLYSRKKADIPFLNYLVHRALVENTECEELLIFQFLVQRFISHDASQAAHKSRLSKLQSLPLTIDNRYLLYAVNRRATQEFASAHLGKGAVSAINVMEFEGRMERARKAHQACVIHMKAFWKAVRKSKREDPDAVATATINEMIVRLGEYDKSIQIAQLEYEWLLEKYSGSVTMLNSYAHFCDAVLNDVVEAEKHRKQANLLDAPADGGDEEDEEEQERLDNAERSTATSESESVRTQTFKYMQSWSHVIMASEVRSLLLLRRRVRLLMLTLSAIATAGYFFTDFYLFNDIAKKNMRLIERTGLFRSYTVGSCYVLRSQMIAAHRNDSAAVSALQGTVEEWTEVLRAQHQENYEHLGSSALAAFYNDAEILTRSPVQGSAEWKADTSTYWTLANDMARRMERGSRATLSDFRSPEFDPEVASPAKLSISFLTENSVRALLPAYETVVELYDEQVQAFGSLTLALVYSNAALNALLVVGIAFFVLSALLHVIQTVQYKYISCWLALTLPFEAVKKLYRFYHDNERLINDLESDEEKNAEDNDEHSDADHGDGKPQPPDGMYRGPDDRYGGARPEWGGREESMEREWAERWRRRGGDGSFRSAGGGAFDGRGQGYRNRPQYEEEGDPYRGGYGGRCGGGRLERDPGQRGYGGGPWGPRDGRRSGPWEEGGGRPQQRVVGRGFGLDGGDEDVEIGARSAGAEQPLRVRAAGEGILAGPAGGRGAGAAGGGVRGEGEGEGAGEQGAGAEKKKKKVSIQVAEEGGEEMQARRKQHGVMGSFKFLQNLGDSFRRKRQGDALQRRFQAVGVSDDVKSSIRGLLLKRQAWFSRRPVYVVSLAIMLGFCLFSILYPPRVVSDITNLGPITNQASRRQYLVWACVHFSRELILDDGFMRMDKATLHGALAWHLKELRRSNRAVRLGHELGVDHGADWHNPEHNTIMYEHGCPWREVAPEKDCKVPGLPTVTVNGLYSLMLNLYDSVEAVLSTYGVDPAEAEAAFARYLEDETPGAAFNRVELRAERLPIMESDENLRFINEAFWGDLHQGLGSTLESFKHESEWILDTVHLESRVFYACYMVLVVVLFYGALFRKTMKTAQHEAVKARGFVHKMPTYILAKEETDIIRTFFAGSGRVRE